MDGWPDKAEPYRTAGGKAVEKTWRFRVSSSNRRTQGDSLRHLAGEFFTRSDPYRTAGSVAAKRFVEPIQPPRVLRVMPS